jgi:uncharacterized protein DUF4129
VSPTPRGRRAWEISVLLALAIVIVAAIAFNLANLEPLGVSAPLAPTPTSGPLIAFFPDPIVVVVLWSFTIVLLVLMILVAFRTRKTIDRRRTSWWSLLPSVLGLLLFVIFLQLIPRSIAPSGNDTATLDRTGANSVPGVSSLANAWPIEAILLLAIFGTIGWMVYRTRSRVDRSSDLSVDVSDEMEDRKAATDAVRETIRDLEIGADVRTAILACFQRFSRLLRSRGIADQDALTAREIEGLAVRTFSVSRDASASLIALFEEARYSVHALGEADRERAIESLGRIRAALEA